MIGLTTDDRERSRAYLGNRKRFATFTEKLQNREQVIVVVNGGSVTLGNGVDPKTLWYSDQLEVWLNEMYPVDSDHRHRVFKMGSHGADDHMNLLDYPETVDMFVLEFGINDYQGEDHKKYFDFKKLTFFEGFQQISSMCRDCCLQVIDKVSKCSMHLS